MKNKLANEYRPTMDKEVLHSWAEDAVIQLEEMSKLLRLSAIAFQYLDEKNKADLAAPKMIRQFLETNGLDKYIYAE